MKTRVTPQVMLLLLVAVAVATLPGCRRREGAKEVRLGYFANLSHAQALLGVSAGDFEKAAAPGHVKTRIFNAGPSLVEALFAGELDIGYLGPGPAMTAHGRTKGHGLRVIAGASANGVVLVARKSLGVTKLEDLRGKKVATPQLGNTQDVSARHFLTAAVGKDGVKLVPAALAEHAALLQRGEIDAAWVPEPWGERLVREGDAAIVLEEKDLWPSHAFPLAVLVTTPEFLDEHRDVVERMVAVHAAWTEKLAREPDKHAAALTGELSKLSGKAMDPAIVTNALRRVTFTLDPLPAGLDAMGTWTYELGFEKMKIRSSGLVDTGVLTAVTASGGPPR